ncbi:cytochrome C oxidase assembly protein [Paenibacillus albiflavus]|uniref:Cytochrome C oxidase assembly protein n=1 Tax=Paenibacillus albiflavus TaxID=2545760 RepID=A0A4R4EEB4_9BACL|nr:cytochrome c oxidase assembly protein [Paenibacillus albiflavus]TCZ77797.1 cytochrome C oxidase assembly protein [Paenibacillus albiflavus]
MNHNHLEISNSFYTMWSPVLILFVIVVGILYFRMVGPWREGFKHSEPVETWRKVMFTVGLVLFYLTQGSPINYYGHHYLFSLHMLQQSILYLIVPILIILGLPEWFLKPVFQIKWLYKIVRFFTFPLVSLLFFNVTFSIYHLPLVMDYLMENELALFGYHAMLLFAAFMMWFPIFVAHPDFNKMPSMQKMLYIFANGILLTPACALIIFAGDLLYAMYRDVSFTTTVYSVLDDQQLGGVIMKIVQEIVYGIVLYSIFRKWYRTERKQHPDELSDEPQEGMVYNHA